MLLPFFYGKMHIAVAIPGVIRLNHNWRPVIMNPTVELILTILQVLVCVVITVLILLQNGKSEGLGSAMSGAAETFFGKNKGRSVEAKLQKVTVILAVAFILLTAVLAIF